MLAMPFAFTAVQFYFFVMPFRSLTFLKVVFFRNLGSDFDKNFNFFDFVVRFGFTGCYPTPAQVKVNVDF